MRLPLKTTWKPQLIQNVASRFIHIMLLLHKLHWLPISFQMQFKMLIITFKALYETRPGYLQHCFSLKTSTHPIRADRVSTLLIPSLKYCHFQRSRKHPFSMADMVLWNIILPEVHQVSTLLTFQKPPKNWLFPQVLG